MRYTVLSVRAIWSAAAVIVLVGIGMAMWPLLTARRQRSAEIALRQKDREQSHQERVAAAVEADAAERRITDLYTRATRTSGRRS